MSIYEDIAEVRRELYMQVPDADRFKIVLTRKQVEQLESELGTLCHFMHPTRIKEGDYICGMRISIQED